MLNVLGAWLSVDAPSFTTLEGADAIKKKKRHVDSKRFTTPGIDHIAKGHVEHSRSNVCLIMYCRPEHEFPAGFTDSLKIKLDFTYSYNFCSSKKCKAEIGKSSTYEVNTRLVYAMRCIGKGAEAARMFCGIMNLPPPPTKFSKYNKMLLGATKDVCDATMKDAVKEAVQENQNIRDIPVAVDGTWQKRGYSSMNGVVTVTSVDTGKKNFNGYSGRMEVDGALSIFQRSVQRYDVRYTKYLGDGDSKAFDNIVKNEVYGDNCTITKLECIGHVMKWMGSRLRRFKAKMRPKNCQMARHYVEKID
ncbi:uncharacterized protein TNCV_2086471 [Trichonephila clavipes]|nr:uncharacterized protein TNCV_2086471 [Trichonephila clavipes]